MGSDQGSCCGFNLRLGTIIIGVVHSIISFTIMILIAAYAQTPEELIEILDPAVVPSMSVLKGLLLTTTATCSLLFIFSVLIVYGALTNNPNLLAPWILFNPITLMVYNAIVLLVIYKLESLQFIIAHIIFGISITGFVCYEILSVYKFYRVLTSLNF